MFGYVVINKPELKFKEFDVYKSFYCGLCYSLRSRYGFVGQFTLSYDMTFLVMLLTSNRRLLILSTNVFVIPLRHSLCLPVFTQITWLI